MKNRLLSTLSLLIILSMLLSPVTSALAQDGGTGGNGGQSDWAGFINADGTLRSDLVDLGETHQEASWMPNLTDPNILNPFSDSFMDPYAQPGDATYHRYMDPNTGNIVVVPSASTLMFMAMNPDSSGLSASSGQLGTGAGAMLQGAGQILAQQFNLDPGWLKSIGYEKPDQFFQSVIDGKTNIFTLPFSSYTTNFLSMLINGSKNEGNIYTSLLLYHPGACASMPGGCPPELAKLIEQQDPCKKPGGCPKEDPCPTHDWKCKAVTPPKCAAPAVFPGKVSTSAKFVAPQHPIVVGQDPEKRGVDLIYTVTVPPTKVVYEELKEHTGGYCKVPIKGEESCPPGKWVGDKEPEFECIKHEVTYRESVLSASAKATLTGNSRSWITGELAARYPGASIKHPDWAWSNGSGGFQGDTYIWTLNIPKVQVADPGYYDMAINGMTSGTAVQGPRPFGGGAGQFGVYLLEATIIQ